MTAQANVKTKMLLELAAECEAGIRPIRDMVLAGWYEVFGHGTTSARYDAWMEGRERFSRLLDAGAYLDAAMTLVPEGYCRSVRKDRDGCISFVWLDIATGVRGEASTEALALCAAALRARAA